ncbi:MAG: ABC transporter ATP-binding protein [Acidobacteriota bacterium]
MGHSSPAIRITKLCKAFARRRSALALLRHPLARPEKVTALRDVDLAVESGEVFGLLGPNGAGKTTLLKILSCLILPDAGRAEIAGRDSAADERAVQRSIGYVTSDERSFYWRLTGTQNLTFFARLHGITGRKIRPLVAGLLERVELTDKAGEPFSSYSSGMKQRLSIARALLHDPPVLFLDEPTRSLDPVSARRIRELVRGELADRDGKTILLATHNLHEAADLCDRMAILTGGRVLRVGNLAQFRTLFHADRRYRLVTDRPVSLAGIAQVLPDHAGRRAADPRGGCSTLLELTGDLTALIRHLAAEQAQVVELTRETPSLEELFQSLFTEEPHADHPQGTA